MALTIGITGGIGSGKSTVCRIFALLGIPIFEADNVAKSLINIHPKIKFELTRLYGKEIYTKTNTINRKKLADIIFNDDIELAKVNNLVHPVVRQEFVNWLKLQSSVYVIHEAAILFESGFYKMMDFTILVSAPENRRIERVSKRDKVYPELVKERMDKQWLDSEKRKLANVEIVNDNKNLVIPQIIEIDKKLKEYGKIW